MNSALFKALLAKAPQPGDPTDPAPQKKREFKDEKDKVAYWMEMRKKYGDKWLAQRMQWMDWANQKLPGGSTPVQLAAKNAKALNLDPEYLLSSNMEEGLGLRFPAKDGYLYDQSDQYAAANKNGELKGYDVDGYAPYGLDTIGDRVNDLIKGGYLPKDFSSKMKVYSAVRSKKEGGAKVNTAAFVDDDAAMQAKAAIMAQERDNLNKYLKEKGLNLSPDAQKFFMLAAYNTGSGNARKMLEQYQQRGLLNGDAFLKTKPDNDNYGQVYNNIMPRLAGGKFFRGEGFFDQTQDQPQQQQPAAVIPQQGNALQKSLKGYMKNADGDLVPVYN